MAWDSKSTRRLQEHYSSIKLGQHNAPVESIVPKSPHVADPTLQPFLAPSFDAADFLNTTLPSLATSPLQHTRSHDVSLTDLSTETQTLLSQLSTHTTRLTNTLTQLTDEILRSGSRLAYEVEILRGETLGLSEALTEGLLDDISKFVPEGLEGILTRKPSRTADTGEGRRRSATVTAPKAPIEEASIEKTSDPAYINQLRTLTAVRSRLDTVIKTFGDAMSWTFPPSEVSVTSSFLSVSAPEPGSEAHSMEEKGQQISKKLRDEIADLLMRADPLDGIEAAAKRVEELKELALVWKGTAEEKGRVKFIDNLARMVEERHRELLRDSDYESRMGSMIEHHGDGFKAQDGSASSDTKTQTGFAFLNQLQKMRGGL